MPFITRPKCRHVATSMSPFQAGLRVVKFRIENEYNTFMFYSKLGIVLRV